MHKKERQPVICNTMDKSKLLLSEIQLRTGRQTWHGLTKAKAIEHREVKNGIHER